LASQLELLDTRRNELRSRRQALQVRLSQFQSTVGLIRALGGGWDVVVPEQVSGTVPATQVGGF
jgi:multidrug efflux system outer membrane protein